jgi:ABC-type lipoprotein release transport system permease subunit
MGLHKAAAPESKGFWILSLPLAWWKLGWLWFSGLGKRSAPGRRALFRTSLWVSTASMALGVSTLSFTLAIVSGFERAIAEAVQDSQGQVLHLVRQWKSLDELKQYIPAQKSQQVSAVFFWTSQGLVVGKSAGRGVMVEGRYDTAQSDSQNELGAVRVSLGRALAELLAVNPGETVRLLLPGILPGAVPAVVASIHNIGQYDLESRSVVVNAHDLRFWMQRKAPELFQSRPGDAHGIRYFFAEPQYQRVDVSRLESWVNHYREHLSQIAPSEDASLHRVSTWKDARRNLFLNSAQNRRELSVILSLLTLVAALNVGATLVVLFLERDREMAILQAMGLGPAKLRWWISLQGLFLGLVSSALGLALAWVLATLIQKSPLGQVPVEVYNIRALPFDWRFVEQGLVFGFGVLSSVAAAFVISWRLSSVSLLSVLGQKR